MIERYLEYDLGFIEFTGRGNLYDKVSSQRVFDLIGEQANDEGGLAVFVFVHGWKHNARHDDSNVVQFREFLSNAAENEVVGRRKVIGLYLGWRGAYFTQPGSRSEQGSTAAARCQFGPEQATLMHILSSDGDRATQVFFPLGEYANITSTLGPKKLKRQVGDKTITLNERALSFATVGNLKQFRTDYLSFDSGARLWTMVKCADNLEKCGVIGQEQQLNHFTVKETDPLAFIKTDRTFIKNHNDAFGCYVQNLYHVGYI